MIHIHMLKICGEPISKPLEIIGKCQFPNECKKANVVQVHIKGYKHVPRNYWPVSLFSKCGKICMVNA